MLADALHRLPAPLRAWLLPAPDSEAADTLRQGKSPWVDSVHLLWSSWIFIVPSFGGGYTARWALITALSYPVFLLLYARVLLAPQKISDADIERIWTPLSSSFFLRHAPEEIAWFTGLCAAREGGADEPLVAVQPHSRRGTTAVLIYAPHRRHGFARATAVLDQQGLTIVDARITPVANGFSLDIYHVLEDNGSAITDLDRVSDMEQSLWNSLRRPEESPMEVSRRAPRQVRMFNTPTRVTLPRDLRNNRSALELVAGDRPGLLCDIGKVLWEEHIDLQGARVSTIGERAEDVFYVTDTSRQPLDDESSERLKTRLIAALTRPS